MWSELFALIGVPMIRSVAGWAQVAWEDGRATDFEVKRLLATILRITSVGMMAYFGLGSMGVDVDLLTTQAAVFLIDWGKSEVIKYKNKVR